MTKLCEQWQGMDENSKFARYASLHRYVYLALKNLHHFA